MKPDEGKHLIFRRFLGSIYRLHSNHWHIVGMVARVEPHSKTRKTNKAGNYIYCGTFALGAEQKRISIDLAIDLNDVCIIQLESIVLCIHRRLYTTHGALEKI